jgi:hypothetical protein
MVSTSQNRRHRFFESAGKYKPWCDGASRWIDTGAALAPSKTAFDYDNQQGREVFGSSCLKAKACHAANTWPRPFRGSSEPFRSHTYERPGGLFFPRPHNSKLAPGIGMLGVPTRPGRGVFMVCRLHINDAGSTQEARNTRSTGGRTLADACLPASVGSHSGRPAIHLVAILASILHACDGQDEARKEKPVRRQADRLPLD